MNLVTASNQWMNRPDDERFWSLEELAANAKRAKEQAREVMKKLSGLSFQPTEDGGFEVCSDTGAKAYISNLAFGQMATRLEYPVSGIAGKLNSDLACQVLEYRKKQILAGNPDEEVNILLDCGEDVTIRSVTSDKYARFHDVDVLPFAFRLQAEGWKVPPGRPVNEGSARTRTATEQDCIRGNGGGGLSIRPGDLIAPSGLYRGDRDMFIFMVNDQNVVDDGGGNALLEGIMIRNSEVGVANFSTTRFICQAVCGNHIIWGAEKVVNVRYRHIGQAVERIHQSMRDMLLDTKPRDWTKELGVIKWMRTHVLGDSRDSVVEAVYGFRQNALTKSVLEAAYDNAEQWVNVDGEPSTWYGFANALTRYSQTLGNADKRYAIDDAAANLFERAAKEAAK